MIGGINFASPQIASIYSQNSNALAEALARISSGKKFQNSLDDLVGFLKSQDLQADISGYETVRENITGFKAYTSAAVTAADSIYENLTEMKQLARQYAGTSDTDLQAEYASEYNALKSQVSSALSSTYVDGNLLTQSGVDITSVDLDPEGTSSVTMNFTDIATMAADLTIDDGEAAVDIEISSMRTYLSEAMTFDGIADQQLNLTDTIINSKQAVMSLITDIDEAEEMNKVLDLSLRQQASVAMLAQGNLVQNSLLKLYE